jgi:nucleotide-binding universal stress UspA family protein
MKRELKHILVPVDFKEPSVHAVRYAFNLAKRLNGDIILLNVIETPGLLADFFTSGDELVKITQMAKEKLIKMANDIGRQDPGIKITTRIERGKPHEKILDVANELKARFIILGENHQNDEKEHELGTTVYHVTIKSPIPVFTMKGNTEKMNDKILVPLDLTKQTRHQLFSAMVYGMNYQAKIYLVSALIGGIKMRDSRIFNKMKKAKKTLEDNGIECYSKLFPRSEVPPYIRVLEYAEEVDAGMILLLTHQEGYTYDNYIGAFAHHIINHSKVPVLSLTSSAIKQNGDEVITSLADPFGFFSKY